MPTPLDVVPDLATPAVKAVFATPIAWAAIAPARPPVLGHD